MILKTDIEFYLTFKVKKIGKRYDTSPQRGGYAFEASIKEIEGYPRKTGLPREMDAYGIFPNIAVDDTYKCKARFEEGGDGYRIYLIGNPTMVLPATSREIARFLKNHVSGLGMKTATAIVDTLGPSAITMIASEPSSLDGIPNLKEPKKSAIVKYCQDNWGGEAVVLALQQYGVPVYISHYLYDKYGAMTLQRINDDPYLIYESGIVPFHYCESIAVKQGRSWNDDYRVLCVVRAAVDDQIDSHGDTCVCYEKVIKLAENKLLRSRNYNAEVKNFPTNENDQLFTCRESAEYIFSEQRYRDALDRLTNAGELVHVHTSNGNDMYYRKSTYAQEMDAANKVVDLLQRRPAITASEKQVRYFLDTHNLGLVQEQKDAVIRSVKHGVSVLTGGPGTGKTFTVTAVIKTLQFFKPGVRIAQVAPTAKAAMRMKELTHLPANTIHAAFKINMSQGKDIGDEEFILDADYLIVDESSMIGIELFDRMLQKLSSKTCVLFVGDDAQLPSVECGDVLHHLVVDKSFIPVSLLSEVHRQSQDSAIVTNAHIIRNGKNIENVGFNEKDFTFVSANTELNAADAVVSEVKRLTKKGIFLDDILVLTPVHATGCGTDVLNSELQVMFNPVAESAPSYVKNENVSFHVGDRVINTRNFTIKDEEGNRTRISNGSIGEIVALKDGAYIEVQFNDMDDTVTYTKSKVDYLDLAYAVTVHKSQGSEAEHVILVCVNSYKHKHMLKKALVYTAVTRAKKEFCCIGDKQSFYDACTALPDKYSSVKGDLSDDTRVSLFARFLKEKAVSAGIATL